MQYRLLAATAALVSLVFAASPSRAQKREGMEYRWFYLNASRLFNDPARMDERIQLVKRAAAAGYNGILLEDLWIGVGDTLSPEYQANLLRFAKAARTAGVELVPQVAVPYGERILRHNPNLAEGLPVEGSEYVVRSGILELTSQPIRVGADGTARVTPRRLYRLKTAGSARVTDMSGRRLTYAKPDAAEILFNSWENDRVRIQGADAVITEAGPVNILRREGTPLRVEGVDGKVYEEGRDFSDVVDPRVEAVRQTGRFDSVHEAPVIRIPSSSRLKDGMRVRISYHHVALVYQEGMEQAFVCLSEPQLYDIWEKQIARYDTVLQPKAYLIGHDEMRCVNTCEKCCDRKLTAGQMVADNTRQALELVRKVRPTATIFAWSDMYSPSENAKDNYYLVRGSLAGGWEGLDKQVVILNWSDRIESYSWFARRGHKQVIAGYYDGEEPKIADWLPKVRERAAVTGAMYTTWRHDYTQLEAFAATCWGTKSTTPNP